MATQTFITPSVIAKEALRLLKNNLVMGNLVYRDYETEFPGMPKTGGDISIRKPNKFKVAKARVRSTKTITEATITLSVSTQAHVSWNFFSVDLTLTIEQYSERYIRPAAAALANIVDSDLCGLYADIPAQVQDSTSGASPSTFMVLGKAMQKMDEEGVPPDERVVVFNPAAHWAFANALSNWNFKEGGEQALRKGFLGRIANAEIFMDQNIKTHTVGKWASAVAVATSSRVFIHSTATSGALGYLPQGSADPNRGEAQNKNLLIGGILQTSLPGFYVGDTFSINGCYAVNPMSGESTGSYRQFVVTAEMTMSHDSTNKAGVVNFMPEMVHTGPYKTVDTIPQKGARIWVEGMPNSTIPANLAFHKNAFALVMVPLFVPDGVWSAQESEDGVSIRVVKDYDIDADSEIIRLDILYGVKTIYPEMACRITGAEVVT
jgi:hypothetical protein